MKDDPRAELLLLTGSVLPQQVSAAQRTGKLLPHKGGRDRVGAFQRHVNVSSPSRVLTRGREIGPVGRSLSELTVVDFEGLVEFLSELFAVPEHSVVPATTRQS
jgi:hypothetical protein